MKLTKKNVWCSKCIATEFLSQSRCVHNCADFSKFVELSRLVEAREALKKQLHDKTLRYVGQLSSVNIATIGEASKYKRYVGLADGVMTLEKFWSIIDDQIDDFLLGGEK